MFFCGLNRESVELVIWNCNESRICWNLAASFSGVNLDQIADLFSGDQLFQKFKSRIGDQSFEALVASSAWALWGARCNLIFNKSKLDCHLVFQKVLQYIKECYSI